MLKTKQSNMIAFTSIILEKLKLMFFVQNIPGNASERLDTGKK